MIFSPLYRAPRPSGGFCPFAPLASLTSICSIALYSRAPIFRRFLACCLKRMTSGKVAWLALAVCLLGILWSRPEPVLRFVDFIGQHPKVIALAVSAALAIGALIIYHAYPLSMDEYAAVFQSKLFASGNLAAQVPPNLVDWLVVRGFNGSFLIASDADRPSHCQAAYWPGLQCC